MGKGCQKAKGKKDKGEKTSGVRQDGKTRGLWEVCISLYLFFYIFVIFLAKKIQARGRQGWEKTKGVRKRKEEKRREK